MEEVRRPEGVGEGLIKLSDGTVLKLKILIVGVKETGFSPFGGVNLDIKVVGGITTVSVPEELRRAVADKPLTPPQPPKSGWEILEVVEQQPAVAVQTVETSKGHFTVRVVAEAVMASRNMEYRTSSNEPVYWVSWVYKVSWRPAGEQD